MAFQAKVTITNIGDLEGASVASESEAIAKVSEIGGDGSFTVTAIAVGTTNINITANGSIPKKIPVTVTLEA